jgi:hypothetical protein
VLYRRYHKSNLDLKAKVESCVKWPFTVIPSPQSDKEEIHVSFPFPFSFLSGKRLTQHMYVPFTQLPKFCFVIIRNLD